MSRARASYQELGLQDLGMLKMLLLLLFATESVSKDFG